MAGVPSKRLLYVGTPFFGYYDHIIDAFERLGLDVDHYNDRPSENGLVKAALKVRPSLLAGVTERYLARIVAETAARDYDLVLIVNGKVATPDFVRQLRDAHPRARFVLYLWDAVSLYPHVVDLADEVDAAYSFDDRDCREHPRLRPLPLFHTPDVARVASSEASVRYDLANVCTVHENRYHVLRKLLPALEKARFSVFSWLYLHPLQYAWNLLKVPAFRQVAPGWFRFKSLPVRAWLKVLAESKAVLDINHEAQAGLTIRTIEALGANRRIVTTNSAVTGYDFYAPDAVFVLDPDAPDLAALRGFLDASWAGFDPTLRARYGVDAWAATLAGDPA